jgi:hemin uptake protein HemP
MTLTDSSGKVVELPDTVCPIEIVLNGKKYILRITKNGKLILN